MGIENEVQWEDNYRESERLERLRTAICLAIDTKLMRKSRSRYDYEDKLRGLIIINVGKSHGESSLLKKVGSTVADFYREIKFDVTEIPVEQEYSLLLNAYRKDRLKYEKKEERQSQNYDILVSKAMGILSIEVKKGKRKEEKLFSRK